MCVCVCVCLCVCVYVCVRVCERESERDSQGERETVCARERAGGREKEKEGQRSDIKVHRSTQDDVLSSVQLTDLGRLCTDGEDTTRTY